MRTLIGPIIEAPDLKQSQQIKWMTEIYHIRSKVALISPTTLCHIGHNLIIAGAKANNFYYCISAVAIIQEIPFHAREITPRTFPKLCHFND